MAALAVALGAAVGAPLRYLVDLALSRPGATFPWGTFTVNVVGSFTLGVLAGTGLVDSALHGPLWGVGLCGALTTYSTFSHQTMQLVEYGKWGWAALNAGATLICCLGAAALGMAC